MHEADLGPLGSVLRSPEEEGEVIEEIASRYADEFYSAEDLVEKAQARLAWRLRRSAEGACSVCGAPLVARRADADTCSRKCRQKKASDRRV